MGMASWIARMNAKYQPAYRVAANNGEYTQYTMNDAGKTLFIHRAADLRERYPFGVIQEARYGVFLDLFDSESAADEFLETCIGLAKRGMIFTFAVYSGIVLRRTCDRFIPLPQEEGNKVPMPTAPAAQDDCTFGSIFAESMLDCTCGECK